VEINTDSKDLNEIIKLLSTTLDYQGEDGYCGLLSLDLTSINCEAAGYQNSSYTVTATREYPHLSSNDLSLIPKTIADNGKTLELDNVRWEVQQYTTVDYEDIPDSYRAVATYSVRASRSVVTGYITTAEYNGEVSRSVNGDTVYTAYFSGTEINPPPKQTATPTPVVPSPVATPSAEPEVIAPEPEPKSGVFSVVPVVIGLGILALLAGAGAYWFLLRHNVKVYKVTDGRRALVAKDKISLKKPVVDMSPLDVDHFVIEIDKHAAKLLDGHSVSFRHGDDSMTHTVAFDSNVYVIEADFGEMELKALH
jgi:hypothetical protein